jgi:hypothetical protein
MVVLISSAFGAALFFVIVAVCVWGMKPVRPPSAQQDCPDCGAIPFAAPARPLRMDGDGFFSFERRPELRLPPITLRVEKIAPLPLAGPVRVGPIHQQPNSCVVSDRVINIVSVRQRVNA